MIDEPRILDYPKTEIHLEELQLPIPPRYKITNVGFQINVATYTESNMPRGGSVTIRPPTYTQEPSFQIKSTTMGRYLTGTG